MKKLLPLLFFLFASCSNETDSITNPSTSMTPEQMRRALNGTWNFVVDSSGYGSTMTAVIPPYEFEADMDIDQNFKAYWGWQKGDFISPFNSYDFRLYCPAVIETVYVDLRCNMISETEFVGVLYETPNSNSYMKVHATKK